jgi:hypothetical protein
MGSGVLLKQAFAKYGKENFSKEIIKFFDSYEDLLLAEAALVTDEFLTREDVYNLANGGKISVFEYINKNKLNLYGKNGQTGYGLENLTNQPNGRKLRDVLIERGEWDQYKDKISNSLTALYESGFENPFKGRTHTDETKSKIGSKSKIHQAGSKNSQYGTRWIHNLSLKVSKRIKQHEAIPEGWLLGRVIKFK